MKISRRRFSQALSAFLLAPFAWFAKPVKAEPKASAKRSLSDLREALDAIDLESRIRSAESREIKKRVLRMVANAPIDTGQFRRRS